MYHTQSMAHTQSVHPDLLSHIVKQLPMRDHIDLAQINSVVYTRFADQLSLRPFIDDRIKTLNKFARLFFTFKDNYLYNAYDDESYVYDLNTEVENLINDLLGEDGWLILDNEIIIEKYIIDEILSMIIPAFEIFISVKPNISLESEIDQAIVLQFVGTQANITLKDILDNIRNFESDDTDSKRSYSLKGFEIVSYNNNELRLYAVIEY